VREALFAFGKLGLLIEDAPDARLRTARELYAADGLPAWWLHCDNLEEGERALEAALEAVVAEQPSWARRLPLLAIIDRYLKEGPTSARAVAWDGGDFGEEVSPAVRKMEEIVRRLLAASATHPVHVALVTSYSGPSRSSASKDLPWELRHHEPVYRLRRRLFHAERDAAWLRQLLYFGPSKTAPILNPLSPGDVFKSEEDQRVALCRALHWQTSITRLRASLAGADPEVACILLTGAGASLASDPLAPGIPATWFLLERACWQVTDGRPERKPVWPRDDRSGQGATEQDEVKSLDELCERYENGASVRNLKWSLERLFERGRRDTRFEDFVAAFRQALQAWDHDFPYHFWLLAQLPWTLILTTNFDGFHERAAASATSLSSAVGADPIRRLGDVLPFADPPPLGPLGSVTISSLLKGPGLLKPYGSLMTVGALALAHDDFWRRLDRVSQEYLKPLLEACRECWIVAVGHRLASDALHHALEDLIQVHGRKLRMLWIEPYPYRSDLEGFAAVRRFRKVLENGAGADPFDHTPVACPLPARALDFAFDLWLDWKRPLQS
jgi:hypothetical protein